MKHVKHATRLGIGTFILVLSSYFSNATDMGTVVVYGSKSSQVNETPSGARVYSAVDIRNSNTRSLPEFLNTVPGIHTASFYGSGSSANVPDFGGFGASASRNTLVLINGQRLNDVDIAAIDISVIPLETIERIEVYPASGSILYGNGASGGTINIITKSGKPEFQSLELTASSHGQLEEAQFVMGSSAGDTEALLSVNTGSAEGYRDNNKFSQDSVVFNISRQASGKHNLSLKSLYNKAGLALPGARKVDIAGGLNELEYDPQGATTPNDYIDNEGVYLQLEDQYRVSSSGLVRTQLGFRNKKQYGLTDFGGGYSSYLENELETASFGMSYEGFFDAFAMSHQLIAGGETYDTVYDSARSHTKDSSRLPIHDVHIVQDLKAWFLQTTTQASEKMVITLGARRETNTTEARDIYNATAPAPPFNFDAQASPLRATEQETLYAAGVRFYFTDQTSFFTNHEESVRFGTVDEFFELDPNTFTSSLDPLAAQVGKTSVAGIETTVSGLHLVFSSFNGKFTNEIHYDPGSFENLNLDRTRRKGSRLEMDYEWNESVSLYWNGSYTRSTFAEGPYRGNEVPMVPARTQNAGINWRANKSLSLFTDASYTGKKYFDNDQQNTFSRIPSYLFWNGGFSVTEKQMQFSVKVFNILNEKAFDYGVKSTFTPGVFNAYPLPERYLQAKLQYKW